MEKDQLGYLQLNDDGAVVASSGDLQNDEIFATQIMALLTLTNQIDAKAFGTNGATATVQGEAETSQCLNATSSGVGQQPPFKRLTITYDDHYYVVCISNRKIHIVKKGMGEHGVSTQSVTDINNVQTVLG